MGDMKVNRAVERLHGYIPFNPSHAEIYEEHQRESFVHADTAAELWLTKRLQTGNPTSLVILTGDAGHGKTHLVRQLLKRLGAKGDLSSVLQNECNGKPRTYDEYTLAIHKDLSETDPQNAAQLLRESITAPYPLIACVNEGRLRAMLSSDILSETSLAGSIRKALHENDIEPDPGIVVLNLNWQMVSLPSGIMVTLLKQLLDGRKWRICQECSAQDLCPIYQNRSILARSEQRLESIRRLYEIVEQLGEVVTIRQVMIHLAWLLTGNLECKDVHNMKRGSTDTSVYSHASTLFGEGAQASFIRSHGLFNRLKLLDPAWSASRRIDDYLVTPEGRQCIPNTAPDRTHITKRHKVDLHTHLSPTEFDIDGKNHLKHESSILERSFAILRRNHLLETEYTPDNPIPIAGFEHVQAFQSLLAGTLKKIARKKIINRLIEGLHRLQYLPRPDGGGLYIVDPISLRARSATAVIAMQVPAKEVTLEPDEPPKPAGDESRSALDAVPRRLWLVVRKHRIGLSLWDFEFLCRCGSGLVSRTFFAREARRITNFLLKVAQDSEEENIDTAQVLYQGRLISITVEDGVVTLD
ncbi:MAG: hypothetical protein ACE366_30635 [Bradymonadia bacterium]